MGIVPASETGTYLSAQPGRNRHAQFVSHLHILSTTIAFKSPRIAKDWLAGGLANPVRVKELRFPSKFSYDQRRISWRSQSAIENVSVEEGIKRRLLVSTERRALPGSPPFSADVPEVLSGAFGPTLLLHECDRPPRPKWAQARQRLKRCHAPDTLYPGVWLGFGFISGDFAANKRSNLLPFILVGANQTITALLFGALPPSQVNFVCCFDLTQDCAVYPQKAT